MLAVAAMPRAAGAHPTAGSELPVFLPISDVIATGHNDAGDGGSGHFSGSLVHASFALYHPINIAVAGFGSSATAEQVNEVTFEQELRSDCRSRGPGR